jgi:predicted Zn-dependent protease
MSLFQRNFRFDAVRGLGALGAAAALLAAFHLHSCATNPATGEREFSLVSEGQEVAIGKESDPAILAEYGAYADPAIEAYVASVGKKLAAVSERPDLEWHFRTLDSPVVNAFALPGGYIYVTRGILATFNSEAQLAGVLGHEIGHVTARHGARQMTRAQLAGLGLGLGSIFSSEFRKYGDLAEQGLGLLFLKYGRGDETQADELAIRYATRAGYDPREIPGTYEMLARMREAGGSSLPGFLSTHPDPGDRAARTRELARAAAEGKTGLRIEEAGHKEKLRGLVYGDDPREGYLEGNRFFHPGLRFVVDFPEGWKVANGRAAVRAQTGDGKALLQLSLEKPEPAPASPSAYVRSLRADGKIVDAVGEAETIGSFPAWTGELAVTDPAGSRSVLLAGFLEKDRGSIFQFLGIPAGSGGVRGPFLSSVRSFRALTDAAKLAVEPDRLDIRTGASGTLEAYLKTVPDLAIPPADVAWLNNLELGATIGKGTLVKVVQRGRR